MLPSALASGFQEASGVLEVIALYVSTKGLDGLQWNTVAGVYVSHLTFAYDDKRFLVDAVLPRIQTEVDTAS